MRIENNTDDGISSEDYDLWRRDRVTKKVCKDLSVQVGLLRAGFEEIYDKPTKLAKLKGKIDAYEEVLNWLS